MGDILVSKLDRGIKKLSKNSSKKISVSVVGGVANNNYLRKYFKNLETKENIKFVYPPKYMMNDNAAMIAWATILKHFNNYDINFKANPRLSI